jgi:hypothetical protein
MRSATAPQIRAAVMIAKVAWKVMKTDSGMVPDMESFSSPARNICDSPPVKVWSAPPSVKAIE